MLWCNRRHDSHKKSRKGLLSTPHAVTMLFHPFSDESITVLLELYKRSELKFILAFGFCDETVSSLRLNS